MARPKRARAKPNGIPEVPVMLPDDLPAPSTSRNLLPRSRATSLARSVSRSLPGSRNSSRHSSLSLANITSLPASVLSESRPPTPAAGGTIPFQSGNLTDPSRQEQVSGPSSTSESNQLQDTGGSLPPSATSSTGSTQSQGREGMDFRQGNSNYAWPLRLGGMPQFLGPHLIDDRDESEDELSMWPDHPATTSSTDNNMPPSGPFSFQNQTTSEGSSSMPYQQSGLMSGLREATDVGGYNASRAGFWTGPTSSRNNDQHSRPPLLQFSTWVPHFGPSQDTVTSSVNSIDMETGTKRKRSPSGEREQESSAGAGTSSSALPQRESEDAQHTGIDQLESGDDDDGEVARQLLYPEGNNGNSPSRVQSGNAYSGPQENQDRKGKGKARAQEPIEAPPLEHPHTSEETIAVSENPTKIKPPGDPLSSYTCPICFSPPTNATITPCGHICCGECLFAAVRTTLQRSGLIGIGMRGGLSEARCPVCRATIPGWDGKGGGVIGLKVRAVFSL